MLNRHIIFLPGLLAIFSGYANAELTGSALNSTQQSNPKAYDQAYQQLTQALQNEALDVTSLNAEGAKKTLLHKAKQQSKTNTPTATISSIGLTEQTTISTHLPPLLQHQKTIQPQH